MEAIEARRKKEQFLRYKHADPEMFQEGRRLCVNSWLDAMESYFIADNILSCFRVNLAKTYLEAIIAQHWQIIAKTLELEGKDTKVWMFFKEALIKAYRNINLE